MKKGYLPTFFVKGRTVPEAYEGALVKVWNEGIEVPTHYDREGDPPSKEATIGVEIEEPFAEPRISRLFPEGPSGLEIYRQEVIEGIHDHWMEPSDPNKWSYTYHDRLFSFGVTDDLKNPNALIPFAKVDQIEYIIDNLAKNWHSRRAQATTWQPTADPKIPGSPCLQKVWCRLLEGDNNYVLNMNTDWRSRDLWGAWFMNVYALTELQKLIVERLSERMREEIKVGRYFDKSDSLHIYGKDFPMAKPRIEAIIKNPDYTQRTWRSDDPLIVDMVKETRWSLATDVDYNAKPESERPKVLEDKVILADGTELMKGENYQLVREDGKVHDRYSLKRTLQNYDF